MRIEVIVCSWCGLPGHGNDQLWERTYVFLYTWLCWAFHRVRVLHSLLFSSLQLCQQKCLEQLYKNTTRSVIVNTRSVIFLIQLSSAQRQRQWERFFSIFVSVLGLKRWKSSAALHVALPVNLTHTTSLPLPCHCQDRARYKIAVSSSNVWNSHTMQVGHLLGLVLNLPSSTLSWFPARLLILYHWNLLSLGVVSILQCVLMDPWVFSFFCIFVDCRGNVGGSEAGGWWHEDGGVPETEREAARGEGGVQGGQGGCRPARHQGTFSSKYLYSVVKLLQPQLPFIQVVVQMSGHSCTNQ
jgi:hypothetical protein